MFKIFALLLVCSMITDQAFGANQCHVCDKTSTPPCPDVYPVAITGLDLSADTDTTCLSCVTEVKIGMKLEDYVLKCGTVAHGSYTAPAGYVGVACDNLNADSCIPTQVAQADLTAFQPKCFECAKGKCPTAVVASDTAVTADFTISAAACQSCKRTVHDHDLKMYSMECSTDSCGDAAMVHTDKSDEELTTCCGTNSDVLNAKCLPSPVVTDADLNTLKGNCRVADTGKASAKDIKDATADTANIKATTDNSCKSCVMELDVAAQKADTEDADVKLKFLCDKKKWCADDDVFTNSTASLFEKCCNGDLCAPEASPAQIAAVRAKYVASGASTTLLSSLVLVLGAALGIVLRH